MTRKLFAACILSLVFTSAGNAQGSASSPEAGANYSKAQLKEFARTAHQPEQYEALANYYGERKRHYLQEAAEEKKEWDRLGLNVASAFAKYPRPVDSARNLYEYYMYEASKAGTREAQYSQMASSHAQVNRE